MNKLKKIVYQKRIAERRIIYKKSIIPIAIKSNFRINIPPNIFQTWHSKNIPPLMAKSIQNIRLLNPNFKYFLYDDNDCREFIKNHFKPDVLQAFDCLIPGAYKADLWRYCILFIYGGIYMDIKYSPINNFKFIHLLEREHLVSDVNNVDIYNAFIVAFPKSEYLYKAIRKIVEHTQTKYYGSNALEPTGPALLSKFISTNDNIVDLYHKELDNNNDKKYIYYQNIPIIKSYKGHIHEVQSNNKTKHYSHLWNDKKIYLF